MKTQILSHPFFIPFTQPALHRSGRSLTWPATAIVCALHLAFSCSLHAQSYNSLIERFSDVKSPEEAGERCLAIFDPSDDRNLGLSNLVHCDDNSVAIHSAWRLHRRELPPTHGHFGIAPIVNYLPDIQRFVGFVEGRLRIEVPQWWEDMLVSPDRLHPQRTEVWTGEWTDFPPSPWDADAMPIRVPDSQEPVIVPSELLRWLVRRSHATQYIALRTADEAVVISKPTAIERSRIACIELTTGRVKWRQEIWGSDQWLHFSTGPAVSPVDVISLDVTNGAITIFGARSFHVEHSRGGTFIHTELHLEQFSMDNGKPQLRFATNNWGVHWEEPPKNDDVE